MNDKRHREPAGTGQRWILISVLVLAACGGGGGGNDDATSAGRVLPNVPITGSGPTLGGCPMFPADAIYNTRIDDTTRFPAHAQSNAWVGLIGSSRRFHADWGTNANPQQTADYYGIPYNLVDGTAATTLWPVVSFDGNSDQTGYGGVPDESDCARAGSSGYTVQRDCTTLAAPARRFPFPLDSLLKQENGACGDAQTCGGADHHVLVVEKGACRLWESYYAYKVGGQWYAYGTSAWDLNSNAQRPAGWTSADAAGLPILPLLARADEASTGEIRHALRVTFLQSVMARSYVWPARHQAGSSGGSIPFGALLRLKSSVTIPATWTPQAQALARAMQRYGLYIADNGSNLYVQGDPSSAWDANTISQIQTLTMGQFEFVNLNAITGRSGFDANSLRASW